MVKDEGLSLKDCLMKNFRSKAGMNQQLRHLLGRLLAEVASKLELAISIEGAYANLGESDKAIEWLETAHNLRLT